MGGNIMKLKKSMLALSIAIASMLSTNVQAVVQDVPNSETDKAIIEIQEKQKFDENQKKDGDYSNSKIQVIDSKFLPDEAPSDSQSRAIYSRTFTKIRYHVLKFVLFNSTLN